jgi:hypothetical protein
MISEGRGMGRWRMRGKDRMRRDEELVVVQGSLLK